MSDSRKRRGSAVRDVDTLAKLQVGTECMLNLPEIIEDLEGFQKVPN